MEVSLLCPHCQTRFQGQAEPQTACPACTGSLFEFCTESFIESQTLSQCPACGAADLYRQKDFNRGLGVTLLIIGIGLSYWTYGLSLLAVTVLDYFLYRFVGEVGCCYQCGALYRGIPSLTKLPPFNLVLFDHYRARK